MPSNQDYRGGNGDYNFNDLKMKKQTTHDPYYNNTLGNKGYDQRGDRFG